MTQLHFDETRSQMICLLGTNGAGKSSSLKVLKSNQLSPTESTPIVNFQSYTWKSPMDNLNHLRIWDCSGFPQIRKMTGLHVKRSKGALIFYNCYRKETIQDLDLWIDLALSKDIPKSNIWIVRTEFDNRNDGQNSGIIMDEIEGKKYADKRGIVHFTLNQYKQQKIKEMYQNFGNLIIDCNLKDFWPKQLIRRRFSDIQKRKQAPKIDVFVCLGIGSMLLGYLAFNYSKLRIK